MSLIPDVTSIRLIINDFIIVKCRLIRSSSVCGISASACGSFESLDYLIAFSDRKIWKRTTREERGGGEDGRQG